MSIVDHVWGASRAADHVWAQVLGLRVREADQRQLVMLKAYIDDSSQDDEIFVLAGHIATAETWAAFSREWEELLPLVPLDSRGLRRFKMAEMPINREGLWKVKCFANLIAKYDVFPVGCCLRKSHLCSMQKAAYLPGPNYDDKLSNKMGPA